MTRKRYRRFRREFKVEAVRLAEQSDDKPITQVARELGIRVNQIYKWKRELESKNQEAFPGRGKRLGKDLEITRLRRELSRLEEENAILKKAAVSSMDRRNTVIQLICWRKKPQGLSWALIQPQGDFV